MNCFIYCRTQVTKEHLLKESEKHQKLIKVTRKKPETQIGGFVYDPACTLITEKPLPTKHLPPLLPFAPQGPFKNPEEVRKQRYKNLNPSLRVMTNFESLADARTAMRNEEWTKRIHDNV